MFKRRVVRSVLSFVLLSLVLVNGAFSYDLPLGLNLGFTTFLDGAPPAGPGFYFTQYVQYITADQLNDADGNDMNLPGTELEAWVSLTQLLYQSDQTLLLGAKWGMDLIVPYVSANLEYDINNPFFPDANNAGFGDILVGPYLQWDPIMGKNGPIFMHRIEFQMLLPTGKYNADKELNPGSNVFSFNPYWSGTLFIMPQWTASLRVHYLWNAENDEPNRLLYGGASDSQAGQAIHLNFASAYEVISPMLRLGVNGYYLKQITDSEVDGNSIDDSKESVFAIGPGAVLSFSKGSHLFFNLYFETDAENRPEGSRFNVRYVHHF